MGCAANTTPLISLIVPVYNNEESLAQTLDSVLAQTYRPLELVCVNDGSRDGSAEILESYAQQCAVLESLTCNIVTQENAGLPAARNAGLAAMSGEIVMFLDADDYLEPLACEKVAQQFASARAIDLVVFGAICEPEDAAPDRLRELLAPEHHMYIPNQYGQMSADYLFHRNLQPYVWRSAYRKDFLDEHQIRFDAHLRFAEDVPFMLLAYSLSGTTIALSDKLYHYVMADNSLTHTLNTAEHRVEKADWHIEAIASLFSEWKARDLADYYLGEAIEWAIDLLLFDFAHMPQEDAVRLAAKFARVLAATYGADWPERYKGSAGAHAATTSAAHKIAQAEQKGSIVLTKVLLARFYLETRGLVACLKRIF